MTSTVQETAAARIVNGTKIYGEGDAEVRALSDVSVEFEKSRFTAIMGPSGSGKSTLLHCIAGLDELTTGETFIGDVELGALKDRALTLLRREKVGFIFQAFNLIPTLTARENITLPLDIAGEDFINSMSTGVQQDLRIWANKVHRPNPVLCEADGYLGEFRKWARQFYSNGSEG